MTLCPALKEKFSGEDAFEQVLAMDGKIYRNFKGRKTLRFEHQGKGYFLKIHPGVGWGEIFKSYTSFRRPVLGAQEEYKAIQALEKIGVQTMTIAGYGLRGRNPARLQSFLITEEIENTLSLEELALNRDKYPLSPRVKRSIIKKVAEIARTMHQNGVNHRDFYLCHFLLPITWLQQKNNIPEPPLHVIDLHRSQVRSQMSSRWLNKDLAGLHFSSMDAGLTSRDRLRFLASYTDQPLRQALKDLDGFWARVDKKAARLYTKFHKISKAREAAHKV